MKIAKIILRDSVRETDKLYDYLIPEGMKVEVGFYCDVPFGKGNKLVKALVYEIEEKDLDKDKDKDKGPSSNLKSINRLIDNRRVLNDDQLELISLIRNRYTCLRSDAIGLMIPSVIGKYNPPMETYVSIKDREETINALSNVEFRSIMQINALEYLLQYGETNRKKLIEDTKSSLSTIKTLSDRGFITLNKRAKEITEYPSFIESKSIDSSFESINLLNDEQKQAVNRITSSSISGEIFLLHGITGSGKTEVYLKCAEEALRKGGGIIYLVPEIALTPQAVSWIYTRFGDKTAVLHSRLTEKEKLIEWKKIRDGKVSVVVGPRSAIFSPIKNLSLIIIDEEHDSSYKSETHPRYLTSEIAMMRSKITGARIILGSATPSISSYYAATNNIYTLLKLRSRAKKEAELPTIYSVDMRNQIKLGAGDLLSLPLRSAMSKAISNNKQVILFLNRRGYSRTMICSSCKNIVMCPNCTTGLTLHLNRRGADRMLVCHYCGYVIKPQEVICDTCKGTGFINSGIGTEQLYEKIKELFPREQILRMDQDTTMKSGSVEEIIDSFRKKKASILIGTQMIAKGHDFPDVTVVGILGADLLSNQENYRSSERAYQLITQASGRAGRGDHKGEVFVQNYNPEQPLIKYSIIGDYESFFKSEINYRKSMSLPPFKAMGELMLSLGSEDELLIKITILSRYLREYISYQDKSLGIELLGPKESPIYELRNRYRMNFIIKAYKKSTIISIFKQVNKDFHPKDYPISYDTDGGGMI